MSGRIVRENDLMWGQDKVETMRDTETVRIDGQINGELYTQGTLVVEEKAIITAKIKAGTVISKGTIMGDIIATEKVQLLSPAVLTGSVKAPRILIEEGVVFNGICEMAKA